MIHWLLLPAFVALLAAERVAGATVANAFVGCVAFAPNDGTSSTGPTSSTGCASYCASITPSYLYSYFQLIDGDIIGTDTTEFEQYNCLCSNSWIGKSDDLVNGDSGACGLDGSSTDDDNYTYRPHYYDARITQTTYKSVDCYGPAVPVGDETASDAASAGDKEYTADLTPQQCTTQCGTSGARFAIYYQDAGDTTGYCRCGSINNEPSGETTCGPNTYHVFGRTLAQAAASGARRRSLRERLERRRNQVIAHCPNNLTACSIRATDGFECIDTQSELESCGACMHGAFGVTDATAQGVDCTSLPGISRGAVTCKAGQCEAFSCQKGWRLVSGVCEKA